jgi:hypothetical protein
MMIPASAEAVAYLAAGIYQELRAQTAAAGASGS